MENERFSIDESGFTGFDLLNVEQRLQGATALAISDTDARALIARFFPNLQAEELKYHSLVKRQSYRKPLIDLQREVLKNFKCVTYVCDKRYLLSLMFLNFAVEPFYYNLGVDLYADGRNYAMASLLVAVGPVMLGEQAFNKLLAQFQRTVKSKSESDLSALVEIVRELPWLQLPEILGPLAMRSQDCLSAIANPNANTDAAFIVLQSLISRMEVMATGSYFVEHDQSENLKNYHDLLKRYVAHSEKVEFKVTEINSLRLPLKLTSVLQVDSKLSPAVQIADVLIGAAIEAGNVLAGHRTAKLDPNEVLSLYASDQLIHLIPTIDFEATKNFHAGTQATKVIEYFSQKIFY